MTYKVESVFPDSIDDLPFISDVDITTINSDYFNMVQNRIYSLQEYLSTLEKCDRINSSTEEPSSPTDGMAWIDD